jgi:hypothetical protein
MQPITEQELKQLIKEAKTEGKNVDDLEKVLSTIHSQGQPQAETKNIKSQHGTIIIQSTGPARKEDFGL